MAFDRERLFGWHDRLALIFGCATWDSGRAAVCRARHEGGIGQCVTVRTQRSPRSDRSLTIRAKPRARSALIDRHVAGIWRSPSPCLCGVSREPLRTRKRTTRAAQNGADRHGRSLHDDRIFLRDSDLLASRAPSVRNRAALPRNGNGGESMMSTHHQHQKP